MPAIFPSHSSSESYVTEFETTYAQYLHTDELPSNNDLTAAAFTMYPDAPEDDPLYPPSDQALNDYLSLYNEPILENSQSPPTPTLPTSDRRTRVRRRHLRPPQTIVHRNAQGEVVANDPSYTRPPPLSSAVSLARRSYRWEAPPETTSTEAVVDLDLLFDEKITTERSNIASSLLPFELVYEDGGQVTHSAVNLLDNVKTFYRTRNRGATNIMFTFKGYNDTSVAQDCTLTHMVIQFAEQAVAGFTGGLVFTSNNPISIEDTRKFDWANKEIFDRFFVNPDGDAVDTDPIAWFDTTQGSLATVMMSQQRTCKYVLIKLLPTIMEFTDIAYIGLIGHSGPRSFPGGRLI